MSAIEITKLEKLYGDFRALGRPHQGRIVTHAQDRMGSGAGKEAADDVEFAQHDAAFHQVPESAGSSARRPG